MDQLAKALQSQIDRLCTAHVDTRLLEEVEGVLTPSGREKLEVAIARLGGLDRLLIQSHRRAQPRRILIDVEIVVKMGNPRPLNLHFPIEDNVGAVIVAIEL